jgi:hypothetical protein
MTVPGALLALALVLVGGCSFTCESERQGGEAGASPPTCLGTDEIDPARRDAVVGEARRIVDLVRQGALSRALATVHPLADTEDLRKAMARALRRIQRRLEAPGGEVELEDLWLVGRAGRHPTVRTVACGAVALGDPRHVSVTAALGNAETAFVALRVPGEPIGHTITVHLRELGDGWKLMGLHATPSTYMGRTAAEVERIAADHMAAGRLLPAYLGYGLAHALSTRTPSYVTARNIRTSKILETMKNDPAFAENIDVLKVAGESYDIHDVGLITTRDEFGPWIRYVTHGPLVKEHVEPEAALLLEHLRTTHPELDDLFDTVLFEAYAEAPTNPSKSYQSWRVPLRLGNG